VFGEGSSYLFAMAGTTLIDRALLRISGAEVRDFLQGLVTSDVAGPLPVWAGLLTPQGKALFDFILWADGDDMLVDCEASQADALARRLSIYRLRRPIVIAREPALAVHWSAGGDQGVADPRLAELGRRWLAPASDAAEGWLAHRLSLGVAEGVAELGQDKTLWLEANGRELGGVSFTKGCYVGQENTARMHHRSKVNRRLVVLRGEGAAEGALLTDAAGRPAGDVRVIYPELGLAVAQLRVELLGNGFLLGGAPATPLVPAWLAAALG
jgi:folate-binding protein YgfZ